MFPSIQIKIQLSRLLFEEGNKICLFRKSLSCQKIISCQFFYLILYKIIFSYNYKSCSYYHFSYYIHNKNSFSHKQEMMHIKKFDLNNYELCNQAQVIGKDLRQLVKDTSVHPFNGIVKIVCSYYDYNTKRYFQQKATGCIVDTNLVLTSANIIYFEPHKATADQIVIYPAQSLKDNNLQMEGGIKVKKYFVKKQFFNKQCQYRSNYDLLFLELQSNDIIKKDQCLSLNFEYQFTNKKDVINISGYGAQFKAVQNCLFCQQNTASIQKDNFLFYKHTTLPGNSGGPVLLKDSKEKYTVIGIHKGSTSNYNYGILLRSLNQKFSQSDKRLGIRFESDKSTEILQILRQKWTDTYLHSFRHQQQNLLNPQNQIKMQEQIKKLKQKLNRAEDEIQKRNKLIKQLSVKVKELQFQIAKINKKQVELKDKQLQYSQKINLKYSPKSMEQMRMVSETCQDLLFMIQQLNFDRSNKNQKINNFQLLQINKYPNLKILDLSSNEIGRIPNLDFLVNLRKLNLEDNILQSIQDFSKGCYPDLQELDLSQNKLKILPAFNATTNLHKLHVYENQISSIIEFASQKHQTLRELKLGSNNLKILPAFKFTPNLLELDVSYNQIENIQQFSAQEHPYLQELDLSHNKLKILPVLSTPNLIKLNLYKNQIENLDMFAAHEYQNLIQLKLGSNKLKILPAFNAFTNLQELYVFNNQIQNISSQFSAQEHQNLLQLDLRYNQLTQIPRLNAPKLSKLLLQSNPISKINNFIQSDVKDGLQVTISNQKSNVNQYLAELKRAQFEPDIQIK